MFGIRLLLRTIFYGVLLWFLFAILWFTLPSPSPESNRGPAAYSTEVLSRGKTLTRVYEVQDFFPHHDIAASDPVSSTVLSNSVALARRTNRWSFALSYTLDQAHRFLRVNDDCPIDLKPPRQRLPFLSSPYATVAKTGDQDGINAPWFSRADATLLFWWIHRDATTIKIRLQWIEIGEVEIWPDSGHFPLEGGSDVHMPAHLQPLLTLHLPPNNTMGPFSASPPATKPSYTLSRTFQLRLAIQMVISRTGLLFYFIFNGLQPIALVLFRVSIYLLQCFGIYCTALWVFWLIRGRPPLDEFLARFPIVSYFNKHFPAHRWRAILWGAAGPIDDDEPRGSERRSIRSVRDFFRSTSPLDDLLASFESTRHLTEPMRWQQRSPSPSAPSDQPVEGFGRHRKVYSDDVSDELIDLEAAIPEKPVLK